MVGLEPSVYYELTFREMGSIARGYEMRQKAMLSRIHLAVWGEAKDIRQAMGKSDAMTLEEYAAMKAEIEAMA